MMTRLCLLATAATLLVTLARPTLAADAAAEAYELRMQGKVDQARALLEETLAKSSGNAATFYELARTQMHMALGNPGNPEQSFADVQRSIEEAVAQDPQNLSYRIYAGHVAYFRAYLALQMGRPTIGEQLAKASAAFEAVVNIKPDYPQAILYLVELHGKLPEDAGADRSKAATYATQLESVDKVYAAKAKSILSPDDCDVEFWTALLAETEPQNADVLEELGKTHLREDQLEEAVKCFERAIERDPAKTYLFLDLSVYHTIRAMRSRRDNEQLFRESLQAGDAAVTRYLNSKPIHPMQAYALGVQSKYKSASDDKQQGRELFERAKSMDPYFSKATGVPIPDMFVPPNKVSERHRYLMRPY